MIGRMMCGPGPCGGFDPFEMRDEMLSAREQVRVEQAAIYLLGRMDIAASDQDAKVDANVQTAYKYAVKMAKKVDAEFKKVEKKKQAEKEKQRVEKQRKYDLEDMQSRVNSAERYLRSSEDTVRNRKERLKKAKKELADAVKASNDESLSEVVRKTMNEKVDGLGREVRNQKKYLKEAERERDNNLEQKEACEQRLAKLQEEKKPGCKHKWMVVSAKGTNLADTKAYVECSECDATGVIDVLSNELFSRVSKGPFEPMSLATFAHLEGRDGVMVDNRVKVENGKQKDKVAPAVSGG